MVQGRHVTVAERHDILRLYCVENRTPVDTWKIVFHENESIIHCDRIKRICDNIDNWTTMEVNHWLSGLAMDSNDPNSSSFLSFILLQYVLMNYSIYNCNNITIIIHTNII